MGDYNTEEEGSYPYHTASPPFLSPPLLTQKCPLFQMEVTSKRGL